MTRKRTEREHMAALARVGMAPAPAAPEALLVRDNRRPGWFWAHNELLDAFAPLVGPYGVAVYLCLVRRCEGNSALVRCSLREIEHTWSEPGGNRPALGRSSIARALGQLAAAGMVRVSKAATRRTPAEYLLVDLKEAATALSVTDRERLVVRLERSRLRSVPEGDSGDFHQTLLKSCGEACGNSPISTEIPGTLESPTGTRECPTGTLSIKDNRQQTPSVGSPGGNPQKALSAQNRKTEAA